MQIFASNDLCAKLNIASDARGSWLEKKKCELEMFL